ncbi:MAG: choice-of-anchor Q domain-containing protein, partial [Nitrososphaerales archaeon]
MFGNSRSLFGGDFTRRLRHLGLAVCLGVPVGVATAVVSDGAAFAAIHTVMNCDNSGAGSLRGAVGAASPGDTIEFSSTATCSSATPITLSSTISITKNLTIQGPGANNLFVSGNNSVDVFSIASGKKVTISTLTIEDGPLLGTSISNSGTLTLKNSNVSGSDGDGVDNSGTLNVIDSTISGNAAGIFTDAGTVNVTNNTLSDNGEGISSSGGTTNVTDSTLSGNGDGVLPEGGTTNVTDSTLSGNDNGIFTDAGTVNVTTSTLSDSDEDGVFTTGGTTNVNRSTFSGNSTGIFTDGGTVSLGTSTVSGNYQYGIAADAGTTNVTNSTLSDDDNGTFNGGGTVNLTATILGDDAGGDCSGGVTDEGYNIDDDSSCTFSATGSVNDSPTLDSHLGPLAYNGGPTQTIAILSGSPAIDKVPAIDCPATDQRGVARTAPCDIGAYDTDGNGEFPYLTVSGPPSATRWSPFQVTVTALNANGTIDKGFSGTVSFTSTDSSAVLPA